MTAAEGTTAAPAARKDIDRFFREALVWDMTLPWSDSNYADADTLPRFHKAGIDLVSLTVSADKHVGPERALLQIAAVYQMAASQPDRFVVIRAAADVLAAKQAGKLALTFNIQGTNPLMGEPVLVEVFYRLGVRHMLLAYNEKNLAGDGCAERTDCGLSRFGIRVIQEMNRVGMLVDGTHTGYRTTMEAMEVSTAPFIFSHANAYGVFAHYRNIRDDQIEACAKTGGVIGVNGLGAFIDDSEARPESMFKHIDYMVNLVGPRHVGLGLDFVRDYKKFWAWVADNPDAWPENGGRPHQLTKFVQPEQVVELAEMMFAHGYKDDDVLDILGRNFLRVAQQVWK